jgi:membrane-associated protease RseP (regulator of RpoE activity)
MVLIMMKHRTYILLAVVACSAQPILAQDTAAYRRLRAEYLTQLQHWSPCAFGPGAAFGVTAYQCASCSFKLDREGNAGPERARGYRRTAQYRPIYGFQSEPIVLETEPNSLLEPGDVIVSVNAQPITTRAGSDLFTYPGPGEYVIRVRRAGTRMDITMRVTHVCANGFTFLRDTTGTPPPSLFGRRGRGGAPEPPPGPDVPAEQRTFDESRMTVDRRFGFGVSCQPSCTRTRARDGSEYYKFDGYPPIIAVITGGVAESAGLREGDQIVEIDGLSILGEQGALRFQRAAQKETLRVTVRRNGEQIAYLLRVR